MSSTNTIGKIVTFTHTAVWGAVEGDLGDLATKKNRIYNVLLDEVQKVDFNNGKENVTIDIYPIEFVEDTDPIVRATKAENAE